MHPVANRDLGSKSPLAKQGRKDFVLFFLFLGGKKLSVVWWYLGLEGELESPETAGCLPCFHTGSKSLASLSGHCIASLSQSLEDSPSQHVIRYFNK